MTATEKGFAIAKGTATATEDLLHPSAMHQDPEDLSIVVQHRIQTVRDHQNLSKKVFFTDPLVSLAAGVGFTTAMYIFFLGIVPFCALVAFLFYYFRQNRTMIKRTPQVYVIDLKPARSVRGLEIRRSSLISCTNRAFLSKCNRLCARESLK